ncbi:unnamed protein product [Cuscuta epithymum]|uniref:Uncharacterized protein n=1 Tax=Cuscuta epithymum TaxID=186058 RepID=A0AAV0FYQ9_9ASTE|nr:unnamed protein product [Cuscuta epithymum]CAH9140459.1 unnamed protein product [Cuscuta epithymum]
MDVWGLRGKRLFQVAKKTLGLAESASTVNQENGHVSILQLTFQFCCCACLLFELAPSIVRGDVDHLQLRVLESRLKRKSRQNDQNYLRHQSTPGEVGFVFVSLMRGLVSFCQKLYEFNS